MTKYNLFKPINTLVFIASMAVSMTAWAENAKLTCVVSETQSGAISAQSPETTTVVVLYSNQSGTAGNIVLLSYPKNCVSSANKPFDIGSSQSSVATITYDRNTRVVTANGTEGMLNPGFGLDPSTAGLRVDMQKKDGILRFVDNIHVNAKPTDIALVNCEYLN